MKQPVEVSIQSLIVGTLKSDMSKVSGFVWLLSVHRDNVLVFNVIMWFLTTINLQSVSLSIYNMWITFCVEKAAVLCLF